jgi:hypothetical protein
MVWAVNTVRSSSAMSVCVAGSFLPSREDCDAVLVFGTHFLQVWLLDACGESELVHEQKTFAHVYDAACIRVGAIDMVLVLSDSGSVSSVLAPLIWHRLLC